jgi:16S rRNA (adenine1518-N6/adenine1519-N6)-dimethyltransferase
MSKNTSQVLFPRPKKHLGQNFLFDPSILKKIMQASELSSEDTVVEIGPGHGRMTKLLAENAKKVIAIELDKSLFDRLKTEIDDYKNIELINGNALYYDYEALPPFKVVANIPYNITTPLIFRLIESRKNLESMTLTIQKEVAKRIVAGPGTKDYGALSIMIQYYTVPTVKFLIPKGAFRPVPKVDSAVIHIKILQTPSVIVKDEKLFFKIIKTAFTKRRKTMLNAIRTLSEDINEKLKLANIDPKRRPETLSIQEFAKLSDIL